jgi:hypothetical protein
LVIRSIREAGAYAVRRAGIPNFRFYDWWWSR